MKLLRIDSSARRNSVSRQLTSRFVETWKKENPNGEVIERDLATTHLPLITDEWTLAAHSDPASLSTSQKHVLALSNALVEEVLAADTIVIGAPMHNFAISALLKGWIDQVVENTQPDLLVVAEFAGGLGPRSHSAGQTRPPPCTLCLSRYTRARPHVHEI